MVRTLASFSGLGNLGLKSPNAWLPAITQAVKIQRVHELCNALAAAKEGEGEAMHKDETRDQGFAHRDASHPRREGRACHWGQEVQQTGPA